MSGAGFNQALGEKRGIVRMADATVPMDDSLSTVALDISGRGYAVLDLPFNGTEIGGWVVTSSVIFWIPSPANPG